MFDLYSIELNKFGYRFRNPVARDLVLAFKGKD
jgi:hypothetical protein